MTNLCSLAVMLYPKDFRKEFGEDIIASFECHYREELRKGRKTASVIAEEIRDVADLFVSSFVERYRRAHSPEDYYGNREVDTVGPFKIVWKMYFAWQADAEAAWLEEMSRQGYHFVEYSLFWYWFRKLPKAKPYRFFFERRFGMNAKEAESFISEWEMDGWEFFKYFAGWYYFRKPATAGEDLG